MSARRNRTAFSGKVVFITGAGSGIGLGLARALAAGGASVIMSDIDPAACESAAQRLRAAGHQATSTGLEVCDGAAAQTGDMTLELWRRVVNINLMGASA